MEKFKRFLEAMLVIADATKPERRHELNEEIRKNAWYISELRRAYRCMEAQIDRLRTIPPDKKMLDVFDCIIHFSYQIVDCATDNAVVTLGNLAHTGYSLLDAQLTKAKTARKAA